MINAFSNSLSRINLSASAALAISVGNSTLPEETYQATLTVEAGDFRDEYKASLMGWTFGKDPSETLTGEYDVVAVPGFGTESDYEGLDVKGYAGDEFLGEAEVSTLSTEVAGGFVGCCIGLYASGNGSEGGYVTFKNFTYKDETKR